MTKNATVFGLSQQMEWLSLAEISWRDCGQSLRHSFLFAPTTPLVLFLR